MSKFKVGDKFRVSSLETFTPRGWQGFEGTITRVTNPPYGGVEYTFSPPMEHYTTTFSEFSKVGMYANLVQAFVGDVVPAFVIGGKDALIEREPPPPPPAALKITRVSLGTSGYWISAKPSKSMLGAVRIGSMYDPEMLDISPEKLREFAKGLLELADQQESLRDR